MAKENLELDHLRPEVREEVSHLKDVTRTLDQTIRQLAGHKQNLSEYLVDYRRQMIEENKFDEDKPLDAFDHEMFAKEESYKAVLRRMSELQDLVDTPYFGKISFAETGTEEEIYIGKYGFIDQKNYEPVIIDWRAPIATLFYHGGLGKAQYNTPAGKSSAQILNRRQFIIKASELLGMFDSEVEVRDEILQYVLSSNAGEKLKDIIMTIQREQDEIIRYKPQGVAVVNGVAGSGKTTIALHRIAWLLYNYRENLEDRVLILGPNNIFMEYISQVLPTLGETSVRQNTIVDFVLDLLEEPDLVILSQEDYLEALSQGDEELYSDSEYKRSAACLASLDRYVESLERDLYPVREIQFLGQTLMTAKEMEKALLKDFAHMPLMKRAIRIKRIIINRLRDVRNKELRAINRRYENTLKKVVEGEAVISDAESSRYDQIRILIEKVIAFRSEITYLGKGSIRELYMRQNSMRILTHEDLIPMLYLKKKLKGIKLDFEVRYLVVDEAQDLSVNHFKVLKDITGCNHATFVGDMNQRLVSWSSQGFMDLYDVYDDVEVFNLNKSYRSTDEIVKYADSFIRTDGSHSLRHGEPVTIESIGDLRDTVPLIKQQYEVMKDAGLESIAIITRDLDSAKELDQLLKGELFYKFIRSEDGVYSSSTLLLSAFLAKGLEFDGVILVDTRKKQETPDLIKYIMSTRALHRLHVIETKNRGLAT